jgi:4-hydroxybenzoate-CoA ligase/benzoate-CoA ligase
MPATAKVDYSTDPATIDIPRDYNAAVEFIDVHADAGRGDKTAFIDDAGAYTYAQLAQRVNRAGNALRELGAELETRVMLCMLDTVDMSAVFWGAIKAGAVAIPVNTLLTTQDYEYIVKDSRARILVVSDALYDKLAPVLTTVETLKEVVIADGSRDGHHSLGDLMASAGDTLIPADTTADDVAFWLYTSGSTGTPKGSMHLHSDLLYTAVHYGKGVLGIREDDVVFSAAKMFFAYGLGNTLTFPLFVGATAAVIAGRPTPDLWCADALRGHPCGREERPRSCVATPAPVRFRRRGLAWRRRQALAGEVRCGNYRWAGQHRDAAHISQ